MKQWKVLKQGVGVADVEPISSAEFTLSILHKVQIIIIIMKKKNKKA